MPKKRRKFDEEFKREAVRLLLSSGEPLNVVAKRLDVTPSSLFRWRQDYGAEEGGKEPSSGIQLSNKERAELERLRKENEELREDRAILKKAAAFFAKESK